MRDNKENTAFWPIWRNGQGYYGPRHFPGLALCPLWHNSHWYFHNGLVTMALLPAALWPWQFVPRLLTAGILSHRHFDRGIMSVHRKRMIRSQSLLMSYQTCDPHHRLLSFLSWTFALTEQAKHKLLLHYMCDSCVTGSMRIVGINMYIISY